METELQKKLKHLPDKPGVYLMKDDREGIIYVGKASSLRNRVRSYFQKGQTNTAKVLVMMTKVVDVDWIVTDTEVEALMLECNLIKKHRPHYNIRLRDDKHYPYLCVTTSEAYPRVIVVRRVRQDGNRYFGPYADSSALRESLKLIRRVFRIRSCNKQLAESGEKRDNPCLNYHIGQCDAPCAGMIRYEQYDELVQGALLLLEGHQDSFIKVLERNMQEAADVLQFERAARFRDQIESIRKISERQKMISTEFTDQDIIAISAESSMTCVEVLSVRAGKLTGEKHFILEGIQDETPDESLTAFLKQYYKDAAFIPKEILVSHDPQEHDILEVWLSSVRKGRVHLIHPQRGEKFRLVMMAAENARLAAKREESQFLHTGADAELDMADLADVLGLSKNPKRIEAYDISNISGTEAVGSMVVFEDGVPAKSQYRRFKIRTIHQPDDYGMMREVLGRRFANIEEGDAKFTRIPDVIMIDGGRGQLNSALEAKSGFDHDIRMISLAKRMEEIYLSDKAEPILLPRDSRALKLLQRIRDEAHRFAITYHRKLREKSAKRSILDSIPGIGDHRRKALIKKFGSVVGVRNASIEELLVVPGVSQQVAQAIFEALHPD